MSVVKEQENIYLIMVWTLKLILGTNNYKIETRYR